MNRLIEILDLIVFATTEDCANNDGEVDREAIRQLAMEAMEIAIKLYRS